MPKLRLLLSAAVVAAVVGVPAVAHAASQPTGYIAVEDFPAAITLTPDGTEAFVVNRNSASVSVIDVATRTVTRTITGMGAPLDVAVAADGTVYATQNGSPTVFVADAGASAVSRTFPIPAQAPAIALAPDGATAWISLEAATDDGDGIAQVDVADGAIEQQFVGSGYQTASDLVVDAAGVVYASFEGIGSIAVISNGTFALVGSLASQQSGLAVSGSTAWVSAGPADGVGTLTQVNLADGTSGWTVAVGILPGAPGVDANGYIYVPGLYSDEITVVAPDGTVVDQRLTSAQSEPFGVAVAAGVGLATLATQAQVAVFDLYQALEQPELPAPPATTPPTTGEPSSAASGGRQLAASGLSDAVGPTAGVGFGMAVIGLVLGVRARRRPTG